MVTSSRILEPADAVRRAGIHGYDGQLRERIYVKAGGELKLACGAKARGECKHGGGATRVGPVCQGFQGGVAARALFGQRHLRAQTAAGFCSWVRASKPGLRARLPNP
ncbi:uncharacterized protein PAN0_136d6793 [Moesziomyces antarcticus]|uniref:Uncharacterized protein n=2 Tax=Pseudozyma antarctica TaxID=84753 RepID=A0A081CPD5_PSEA2|nr:uncharacterized protein PAN0_136d6793 [Moesziomyces antarcticus]GAK68531.1 hypothetical protein PAN0_136d6793 [Moesziomyces antarcticus]SPO47013.1 uncharacterized protein PSANT_04699 [Moesziomyces antarcticus]